MNVGSTAISSEKAGVEGFSIINPLVDAGIPGCRDKRNVPFWGDRFLMLSEFSQFHRCLLPFYQRLLKKEAAYTVHYQYWNTGLDNPVLRKLALKRKALLSHGQAKQEHQRLTRYAYQFHPFLKNPSWLVLNV